MPACETEDNDEGALNERSRREEPWQRAGIGQTECRITYVFNEATKAFLTAADLIARNRLDVHKLLSQPT
jgi:hypothetical protein